MEKTREWKQYLMVVAGSALFRAPDPAPVIRLLHGEA